MDDAKWDTNMKRFRWLKIGCVCALVFRLLVLIFKWIVLYVRLIELRTILVLWFIVPIFTVGGFCTVLHINNIYHELKEDLKWFRTWYCSVFVLHTLFFWLHLYPYMLVLIWYHWLAYGRHTFLTVDYIFDIAEPVLSLTIQALVTILLFRPYLSCLDNNETTSEQRAVYSNYSCQVSVSGSEHVLCTDSNDIDDSNETCCSKKILFVFSIVHYCIYVWLVAVLVYFMSV